MDTPKRLSKCHSGQSEIISSDLRRLSFFRQPASRQVGPPFWLLPADPFIGTPLTYRNDARSCILVTGHIKYRSVDLDWAGLGWSGLVWAGLARPNQIIVVYVELPGLKELGRQLIAHGLTTNATATQLKPPMLIIVREVVKLHQKLARYHPKTDTARVNRAKPCHRHLPA